jgi:hypothetical protein
MIDLRRVGTGRQPDMPGTFEIRHNSCAASSRRAKLIGIKFLALALTMLGGCSTTIINHTNPSGQGPSRWAALDHLPIELHGDFPGLSAADLTSRLQAAAPNLLFASSGTLPVPSSRRRVVMFLNSSSKLVLNAMCGAGSNFHAGNQTGRRATVSGALCDGTTVISTVSGTVVTQSRSADELASSFRIIRDELYWTLYPNDYGA